MLARPFRPRRFDVAHETPHFCVVSAIGFDGVLEGGEGGLSADAESFLVRHHVERKRKSAVEPSHKAIASREWGVAGCRVEVDFVNRQFCVAAIVLQNVEGAVHFARRHILMRSCIQWQIHLFIVVP